MYMEYLNFSKTIVESYKKDREAGKMPHPQEWQELLQLCIWRRERVRLSGSLYSIAGKKLKPATGRYGGICLWPQHLGG